MRDIQLDVMNMPLKRFAETVVRKSAASDATIAVLKGWDGRMVPGSAAALIANDIRTCSAAKIADDNKPAPAALVRERVLQDALDRPNRTRGTDRAVINPDDPGALG